jgi:hypothetical protein
MLDLSYEVLIVECNVWLSPAIMGCNGESFLGGLFLNSGSVDLVLGVG